MKLSPSQFVALLLGIGTSVYSLPVTIEWPQGTEGTYSMPAVMQKPANQSGTYDIPELTNIRLVGTGFDLSFKLQNGKLKVLSVKPQGAASVDPESNTITFQSANITVTTSNLSCDVGIDTIPARKVEGERSLGAKWSQTYKLVKGNQRLIYAGIRHPFTIDEKGNVSLQYKLAGVTVQGSTITLQGLPFEVVPPSENQSWNVSGVKGNGKSDIYLLPNTDKGYAFQSNFKTPFFINNDGLLSLKKEGPFVELITLDDPKGGTPGKIMIPNGEAKYFVRTQKAQAEKANRDKVLAASDVASWKKDFVLEEKMKIYDFPSELLTYPVDIPGGVDPKKLQLLAFTKNSVRTTPFHLSRSASPSGQSCIHFVTDLPSGSTRLFRLLSDFDASGIEKTTIEAPSLQPDAASREAILSNNLLFVKVPYGHLDFQGGKPLSQVPAPILGIARKLHPQPWTCTGSFSGSSALLVTSVDTRLVETGPLFTTYELTYHLNDGKTYTVRLELRANEFYVRLAESLTGFSPSDNAVFRLDYRLALDPDRRLVPSLSGYESFSGNYNKGALANGQLNYSLGIYTPNKLGVMHSTAIYNEDGTDALLVVLHRLKDWQTTKRALWSSSSAYENIRFYQRDQQKYLTAGLAGSKRYWVLGLIPRDQVVLNPMPGGSTPAGPEAWLETALSTWSLEAYKDRVVDWPEKTDAAPFNSPDFLEFQSHKPFRQLSFEEFEKAHTRFGTKWFFEFLNTFGGDSGRGVPAILGDYACSRASWTQEQRDQVRQIMVFLADYRDGDDCLPHHSMLGGHPNFAIDDIQTVAIAAALFPTHPKANYWRDSFMRFYNEWLDKYARKDVPEFNTKGGRWSENIACYVGQCFVGLSHAQKSLHFYDGTSLGKNPQLIGVIRWMRDSFMSPHEGVRMIPPQGAHSIAFEPNAASGFWRTFFDFCADLAPDDSQLAQEMRWIETNGKEGKNPNIHSALYTDYGPVFHYDFGGPHESYAHLQNINGMNYRWTAAGIVYYGAKNKVWSYNTMETNGDEFDWKGLSAFTVNGKGLKNGPTDQLLYDFDFAQFYRQSAQEEAENYRARGVMLLRDDYLVLCDEVKRPDIPGTFNWCSVYDLPEIYQLKPGAPMVESTSRDPQPPRPDGPDRIGKVHSYTGKGDFLTVVAPVKVRAEAKPFGGIVNGEYIFASQNAEEVKEGSVVFSGNYGYARLNQLALFQGTKIGLNEFMLQRDGGDFGFSGSVEKNRILGRIVGRSGGKIIVRPPTGFNAASATVMIEGHPVKHYLNQGAICFFVEIFQKDGMKNYTIEFRQ